MNIQNVNLYAGDRAVGILGLQYITRTQSHIQQFCRGGTPDLVFCNDDRVPSRFSVLRLALAGAKSATYERVQHTCEKLLSRCVSLWATRR